MRVIAATHRNLREMVAAGTFREDLYQRSGSSISIPSLRSRKVDIPILAIYLLTAWNARHQHQKRLSPTSINELIRYPWPGNVRELRRVIQQSAMLASGKVIQPEDLRFEAPLRTDPMSALPDPTEGFKLNDFLDEIKLRMIERSMELSDGVQARAARLLGLTPEQQEQLSEQTADSASVDYDKEQVSRKVFNKDTDRAILRNLMEKGIRNADGTRLGKTIIFARNHRHAKLLVEVFDELYPQYGGDFCSRIDNYEPRAEQLISDFKSKDGSKNLTIAVSVDMLDTGIDIPEIVNLVFAKPVKSYSKFWQMIGRGTRLCENLFGPGKHKSTFQIFDHWGNFEYFDELKKEVAPARGKSLTEQLFEARIQLAETALGKQDRPHRRRHLGAPGGLPVHS